MHTNVRDAAAALQAKHSAVVSNVQRTLAGGKLSNSERQEVDDLLDALAWLLAGDGPAHEQLGYLLEGLVAAARLRRAAEAVAP
jgi:hypothetical protein